MAINLATLTPPDIIQNADFETILQEINAFFIATNPAYTSIIEGDPAFTVQQAMAYFGVKIFARVNDAAKATLTTHATGSDLEHRAAGFNLERREGETDEELRLRVLDVLETLVPGSPAWYRNYALEASQNIQDARVLQKPDPNNPGKTIGGELNIYVQGRQTVLPDAVTLQAVRNYIAAEGATYTDPQVQDIAEQRRFTCDTVNILTVNVHYYVLCAEISVLPGLDKLAVLADVQQRAQTFVDAHTRIGRRIPVSSIYAVLDTDAVSEVTLIYPTSHIVVDDLTVPCAIGEQTFEVPVTYKAFTTWDTFADATGPAFSLGENNGNPYILFNQDIDALDKLRLQNVRQCNRFGVYEIGDDGEATELLHTFRVDTQQAMFTNSNSRVHTYFELDATPATGRLTADETIS